MNRDLKELITAALPYANGDLHLGHLMSTYLPADEYRRYCGLRGREALFVCATDEHGAPIQFNAEKQGVAPEEFVKKYRKKHVVDFHRMGVEFDAFHYTDSPENAELTRSFYAALDAKGRFYEKEVKQTHCPKCNRVLPDRYVKGDCPHCGSPEQYGDGCETCGKTHSPFELINPRCAVCGTKPEARASKHLFFKLSSYKDFFKEWFPKSGFQADVLNYVGNWVEDLKDWDITRDGPYFGIPIPGRENQFFYVWFDAPIGYVASTKAWCDANNSRVDDWWKNPDCRITHFIGKDIVYHHYLFWPAMLDAAGYSLPSRIPARGYLNMSGEKMSKSRGTFVLLQDVDVPSDYVRYYLTAITPNTTADVNYSRHELREKVNKELVNAYGNFVNRSLSFIKSKRGGRVPDVVPTEPEDKAFRAEADTLLERVAVHYEALDFKRALEEAMAFAGVANKYFNDRQPWKIDEPDVILANSAFAAFVLSVALNPIIPDGTGRALASLNCPLVWDPGAFVAGELGEVKPLFPKIEAQENTKRD